jgi:hypothetical protein
MRRRDKLLAVAAVIVLVATLKFAQQVYRWVVFADERSQIGRVEAELQEAALGVIRTQITADSLRIRIEAVDSNLDQEREQLDRYESQALRGTISRSTETRYRAELASYNRQVAQRNELFLDWRETIDRNHAQVDRYNLLADSVRTLAAEIGEPYYPILSPAEVAERRGLLGEEQSPS